MSEPVVSREQIVQEVRLAISLGTEHINKYPPGSDAAAAWDATVQRLREAEVQDSDGGA